jgi:hemerythrin-like domain-containing protein
MHVLERQADSLDVDGVPDYPLLAAIVAYVRTYADTVHHPTEDKVFDQLLHKGLIPAERHVVFLNLGKHQEIKEHSRKLHDSIESIANGNVLTNEKLLEDIRQYLLQQRKHMAFEELHLFPLVESRLNHEDWILIDAELMPSSDPLFDNKLEEFRMLYEYIIEAER